MNALSNGISSAFVKCMHALSRSCFIFQLRGMSGGERLIHLSIEFIETGNSARGWKILKAHVENLEQAVAWARSKAGVRPVLKPCIYRPCSDYLG